MLDNYQRKITYLRLSVTELCNLRCRYCMPEDGVCQKTHDEMLTEDEMINAVKAAASLGINKVRITGGEPLVKKNILSICKRTAEVEGISEVCMTTNGTMLPQLAHQLKECGVKRLNLSLDTLDPEKYHYITRRGELQNALKGIDAAIEAGFDKIKINVVLMGGFNDDEIPALANLTRKYPVDVRFIELMPMYDGGEFGENAYISCSRVLEALPELVSDKPDGGVANLYRFTDAYGDIGLIRPLSDKFCGQCNRIRLTADGMLKPCLHSPGEYSVKGLSEGEMVEVMKKAILSKPLCHKEMSAQMRSQAGRNMNEIGG